MALVLGWVGSALASDGVREINQVCAAQGCFANDAPGFPVTITLAGSYRLTSNLATLDKRVNAILVDANDVSIDLNGFTIACTFATLIQPPGCGPMFPAGTGRGVSNTSFKSNTRVSNGTIRDMGSDGLWLPSLSEATDVVALNNGGNGIRVGFGAIRRCLASGNGGYGFSLSRSLIEESSAHNNGSGGIAGGHVIRHNVVTLNSGPGIVALGAAQVIGNAVSENNIGLKLSPTTSYSHNAVSGNSTNQISNGVNGGGNSCSGTGTVSVTCP